MASRVQQHQQEVRGEAVVGVNKNVRKNAAAGEGINRRVLGDIGNLVAVRGMEGKLQPSRPITRSFCAQLLANAQAAAATENNKKQVCVNVEKVPAAGVDGVAAAAPIVKEVVKQEKPVKTKKEGEGSTKKNKPTLTSVLTARSKAACGIAKKLKEQIIDIDAADVNNDLAGVEYVEDIYKFYKLVENESRPNNYMEMQPEINEKMRAILVDWLIDVHQKFELSPETFYLTINIIDRFLSVKKVPRKELQLVGIGATLMASKYEEIWAPEVNDLVCISDRAYSHEQILVMEKTILANLEWTLTVPTHYVFLARFIKASIPEKEVENMVNFIAELGMMHFDTIMFCPSMVAASAVYVARCTLNKTPFWTDTLKKHTGFSEPQLKDCAGLLVYYHSKAAEHRLQTIYRKYSKSERGAVALLPPAKSLLPGGLSK
ncbi:G2/MITOTIC-SPECIFIC CYCLIN S13-6 [Salix purpurea]|uniref:B-like cyclin n=1 Tax=Salix purpurea TaxID=77065 RepID=A0A9Q0Q598_SALPP|nr:G2/MITOTIC-SPECIFIC CYCLIN S13-6 [Salix purpurea]